MKIQEQNINKENGTAFWTIYFEHIVNNKISESDWNYINYLIELSLNKIEKSEKPINLTSSQTEISDEEIEKAASRLSGVSSIAFEEGAKWYREQLKSKQ